jgi:hypothetical protein
MIMNSKQDLQPKQFDYKLKMDVRRCRAGPVVHLSSQPVCRGVASNPCSLKWASKQNAVRIPSRRIV